MLRHKADIRTVVFMAITTSLLVINWSMASFNGWIFTAAMFMAVTVAVTAHNHNHVRIWKNKKLNALTDYWITAFYGFPAFAWIPTHNMNHHKLTNKPGDYTITYRMSEKNNLLTLLTYPTISGYHQQKPTRDYLKSMRSKNSKRFWFSVSQYIFLAAWIGIFLALDWRKALLYVVIPQQFSLFAVLVFNYVQHVHADEEHEFNHSRNFVGWGLNAFLFNNGYHTAHHLKQGLHWSKTAELQKELEPKIDPSLNEKSFWWYMIRAYILGAFIPAFRTKSMRVARLESSEQAPPQAVAASAA